MLVAVSQYYPVDLSPVSVSLGTWAATGLPNREVTLTLDPRLLEWMVRNASRRSPQTYSVEFGTPNLTVDLA